MDNSARLLPYRSIPVLLYHQIADTLPEEDRLRLAVTPRAFERQLRYLHEEGYTVISLDEHLREYESMTPRDKVVAITFDDGYLDNYTNAMPILSRYGFTATIFLVSGFMGRTHAWKECTPARYMEWTHAEEMNRHGISFGNHTCSHPDLTALSGEEVFHEITYSHKTIEDKLGAPVLQFSYPYGKYNKSVVDAVIRSGAVSAYSVGATDWHRYTMERFMITSKDGMGLFRLKASGSASWVRSIYKRVRGEKRW